MSEQVQTYLDRTEGPGTWGDIKYKARRTFTMKLDNGEKQNVDDLRAEVERLRRQLLEKEIERDVEDHRVLPRDRDLFLKAMGANATIADWHDFRAKTPQPQVFGSRSLAPRGKEHDSTSEPDVEVVARARNLVDRSDGKLTYSQAALKVLEADPELAYRYTRMVGNV